ncbi:four helix bundle protein [Patescibacteria group bacterium]|nr:MAG: four helix bundle protein [Patescibacteria group bacterium]
MFRFEGLEIWQLAIKYAEKLYSVSRAFPDEERYALADQLRRAAISISNNIAEGSGGTDREFRNFLSMSVKSTLECINILIIAERLRYISRATKDSLYEEGERLIRKIRSFRNTFP